MAPPVFALRRRMNWIATDGPVIFDCIVTKDENCFPMIPSGAAHNEMLLADDQGLDVEVSDAGKAMV
jgi:acetolactate synthase I/II/III large subunit